MCIVYHDRSSDPTICSYGHKVTGPIYDKKEIDFPASWGVDTANPVTMYFTEWTVSIIVLTKSDSHKSSVLH